MFYRSIVYANEELGISQLYVYEEYLPEIILTPCIGSRGVLWQEINGRKRNSSARMLFPIFCNTIPENIFLMSWENTVGKYAGEYRVPTGMWQLKSPSPPNITITCFSIRKQRLIRTAEREIKVPPYQLP